MAIRPAGISSAAGGAGLDWTLKAAMLGGRDVSDEPLEIAGEDLGGVVLVFTDRPTSSRALSATRKARAIRTRMWSSSPPTISAGRSSSIRRRARSVRTSKTGVYTIQGLPPGEYYVVAISSTSTREWQDPKFLEAAAPLATRVTILDGDKKTQDLRTSRLR